MAYALQQLVNGLMLGMIYGLIAVGYTMVYSIIGKINFAHGDVLLIGAFIGIIVLTALTGITSVPLGLLAALLGIDTSRTISITFIIGSALAAVAGVMFLLYYCVIGFNAGIKAFTAAERAGAGEF